MWREEVKEGRVGAEHEDKTSHGCRLKFGREEVGWEDVADLTLASDCIADRFDEWVVCAVRVGEVNVGVDNG